MSPEPGILDANVLIYAVASEAPQHPASRALLEAVRDDPGVTFCVTSLGSTRKKARKPIPARAVEGWMDLLRRRPVTGADVFDLQLVAVMLANDVKRIYTFNTSDFERFPELTVNQP